MKQVLFFNTMLTPKLVTGLYWVLLLAAFISGISAMFMGQGISGFFLGLVTMLGGAVGARVWCELMIVLFKINENLQAVRDRKE